VSRASFAGKWKQGLHARHPLVGMAEERRRTDPAKHPGRLSAAGKAPGRRSALRPLSPGGRSNAEARPHRRPAVVEEGQRGGAQAVGGINQKAPGRKVVGAGPGKIKIQGRTAVRPDLEFLYAGR
jgi:hypothetical protein